MVAIPAREADSFARTDFAKFPVVLFFGPDEGLVSERAEAVAKATAAGDAANIIRFDGDEVAAAPERLAEEAHAISMFGGNRAIRIRAGAKALTEALKPLLSTPPIDTRVVIEAGDIKGNAPLRQLIEKAANAAAVPCYAEGGRDLARLVDDMLEPVRLKIAPAAHQLLIQSLGQDRRRSRMEVEKLIMYAKGKPGIEVEDVEAIVTDAAAISIDLLVDAVFSGRIDAVETEARRVFQDGMEPAVLLGFALRHALQLMEGRHQMDGGKRAVDATEAMRIHFKRKAAFSEQLSRWTDARLHRAVQILGDATLAVRRNAALGEATAIRAFWSLALSVGRG
jgi:DNA polymerase III subunit delta